MQQQSHLRTPSIIASALLVGLFYAAALPQPAQAQFWEKLKEKAEEAEEAAQQIEELVDAVRCVISDKECIKEAKAEGKPVVLTDKQGKVLTNEKGEPITDPAQLPPGQQEISGDIEVTDLGKLPEEVFERYGRGFDMLAVSDDGRHAAFVTMEGSRFVVMYDGKAGPPFDEIVPTYGEVATKPTLSPNGQHVAYVARKDGKITMVLDHETGPAYDAFHNITFSPDGERLAYQAKSGEKWHVVVDGKQGPGFFQIMEMQFNTDGSRFGYFGKTKEEGVAADDYMHWIAVVDGTKYPGGISVSDHLQFSDRGGHFAYTIRNEYRHSYRNQAVIDGKVHPLPGSVSRVMLSKNGETAASIAFVYPENGPQRLLLFVNGKKVVEGVGNEVGQVVLSPDGKHFAAVKRLEHEGFAVVRDGKQGLEYQRIGYVTFSPDSEHLLYTVRQGSQGFIVIDGEERKLPGPLDSDFNPARKPILFSPDGQRMAFMTRRRLLFVDGEQVGKLSYGRIFRFSPDSKHWAYSTMANGSSVVVDGNKRPLPPRKLLGLKFTPDSRAVGYLLAGGYLGCQVVVGDWKGPKYPDHSCATGPVFSPDSKHVAYVTSRSKNGGEHVAIVDGQEIASYDFILIGEFTEEEVNTFRFDSDGKLRFLAIEEGTLYRVTYTPGAESPLASAAN